MKSSSCASNAHAATASLRPGPFLSEVTLRRTAFCASRPESAWRAASACGSCLSNSQACSAREMERALPASTESARALACASYLLSSRCAVSSSSTSAGPPSFSSPTTCRRRGMSLASSAWCSSSGCVSCISRHLLTSASASTSSGSWQKPHFSSATARASERRAFRAALISCMPTCHLPSRARARIRRAAISISKACRS
mmetsp:Transcript_113424/g.299561  ORF Transcript_113424/g.299561 Transcript_113424/m.299561 type:complete len:200 (+) Transcript_113424:104-703(+)